MPLAGSSWLDDGDKIASIVSAVLAVASLTLSLVQARHLSPPVAQTLPARRWRLGVTGGCAAVGMAAAALVIWGPPGSHVAGVALGGLAAAVAIVMTVSGIVASLRAPKRLDPAVRRLLDAQLSGADHHRYAFGSLPLPGVSLIYVEQHLSASRVGRTATRIIDVNEFVRNSPKAIVIGAPGAGKSTFAAHVVGVSAGWWTQARVMSRISAAPFGRLLPVLLPAKFLADGDVSHSLATRWSQANVTQDMFTRPPHRRVDWLIIVDSLDEISDGEVRTRVIQSLGAFIASGTRSRLMVTTRALTAGELADLVVRGAQEFHLRLFGQDELRNFASRWFIARGGGQIDPVAEATRFLGYVRASGLTSIVRVPLLATMAVLVYESDHDRMLPTSRAGLYEEFVCLLRSARDLSSATPFEAWLAGSMDHLLRELAASLMRDDSLRLLPWAHAWVESNVPAEVLSGSEVERLGILRNSLIASGLCVFAPSLDAGTVGNGDGGYGMAAAAPERLTESGSFLAGNDVEFVHFTIAEYLAAEPSVHTFSYDRFRSLMENGRTRGFALFGLARSSADPSRVVGSLLHDNDPINAGRIVADGIPVSVALRRRVIDALVDRVTQEHPTVSDCVALLGDLAIGPDVQARLRALVDDSDQTLWVRVVVADALADLDAGGPQLLQVLVQQGPRGEPEALWWARQRLADRAGSTVPPSEAAPQNIVGSRSLGEIGRQACITTATDGRQPAAVRLRAARILYEATEPTGAGVLRELIRTGDLPPHLRLEAARLIVALKDHRDCAIQALHALARADQTASLHVPAAIRVAAANELLTQGDMAGIEALRGLARNFELSSQQRHQIVEQLVARADPLGRELLTQLHRRETRRRTLVRLAGASIVVAGLLAVANRALLTGQRLVAEGVALGMATIVLTLTNNLSLPRVGTLRQSQYGPARPRLLRREDATRSVDHLAAAVAAALIDERKRLSGDWIRTYLAAAGQNDASAFEPVALAGMLDQRRRQIVVLGPPGSGKTSVATALVLELLRRRDAGSAVPVLFTLRSWSASNRSIEDWMATSLSRDYIMPTAQTRDLVSAGQILPILDGLDEVTSDRRRRAVIEINAMARTGTMCVVTCRSSEYAELTPQNGATDAATVFEILPLRSQDIVEFIVKSVTNDRLKAWTSVIRQIEQDPAGPLVQLMSSPLAARITLTPYLASDRDPEYLLRQVHSRSLPGAAPADRVFGDYIAASLRELGSYPPRRAERWLRTLARQARGPNVIGFSWRSVQNWLGFAVLKAVAVATVVPTLIVAVWGLMSGTAELVPVLAASAMVLGLLVVSSVLASDAAASKRQGGSSVGATAMAVVLAGGMAGGAALLGFLGPGRPGDAFVLAVASAGSLWATDAGRFQLSRAWLALSRRLPWSLERFLTATTRAGITRYDGTTYQFSHVMVEDYFMRDD